MTHVSSSTVIVPPPASSASPDAVSVVELYRQMWIYAAGARAWLVLSSVMLVASQLVKLLVPWCTAKAIETLQKASGGGSLGACLPWLGGIVALYVVCWSLHGPGRVIERSVALRVRRALTDRLYARLVDAPLGWHGTHHSAELAHRMTQATQALSNFTQSQFIYLQNGVNLVGPLVALALLSALTGSVAIVGLGLVAITIVSFDRATMRLARIENDAERKHGAALLDCLTNILTVLSLRLHETTRRLLARRLDALAKPLQRGISLNEWKWCAVDLLTVVLTWGLVALYAWHSRLDGALMLGGVFMVYQYAQQSGGVIGSLASNLQNFARIRTDFASAAPIWNAPRTQRVEREVSKAREWNHIDLCELTFEHAATAEGQRETLVTRVSLRLHAGERIALVGPSGAGKSTMLRVIAGLSEPTSGHVEIDGIPRLGLRHLRHCATLVPQEAQVFEATVRENIAFDHEHGDDEIAAAARIASFDTVVAVLPRGFDTAIAQGGGNLSGGQRQRLCLARGVLAARGSSVLLLDEPTSALDPVTESMVYERLDAAFPDACILASVHRMSLLARFDRVALIDKGQIVDVGTVAELLERQRVFRDMMGSESEREAEAIAV